MRTNDRNVRIDDESYEKASKIAKKRYMKINAVVKLAIDNLAKKEKIVFNGAERESVKGDE